MLILVRNTPHVQCYNSSLCFCPKGFQLNRDLNECILIVSNLETKGFSSKCK